MRTQWLRTRNSMLSIMYEMLYSFRFIFEENKKKIVFTFPHCICVKVFIVVASAINLISLRCVPFSVRFDDSSLNSRTYSYDMTRIAIKWRSSGNKERQKTWRRNNNNNKNFVQEKIEKEEEEESATTLWTYCKRQSNDKDMLHTTQPTQ